MNTPDIERGHPVEVWERRLQQAIEVVYLSAKQWLEFGTYEESELVDDNLRDAVMAAIKVETEKP